MNSTIAVIINLPMLLLLYLIMFFTQALSGKRQFYGVSLNSDYFNKKEFKSLDKKFKSLLTIGFLIFIIITLVFLSSKSFISKDKSFFKAFTLL